MLSPSFFFPVKRVIPCLLCLLPAFPAFSQLSVGASDALFIANGTDFSTDSLVLTPSADLTLSNNSIVKVATPVGSATPGITSLARVYTMSAPFTYSGTLGLFYLDNELGGNTEGLLQIAYIQTTGSGTWTTTTTSSVNTATNYVSSTVSSVPLAGVTATTLGVILPITYSNFSAQLENQFILVSWEAESTTPLAGFDVESSADGINWKKTGYVSAIQDETTYTFKDADLDFGVRYYRIAIVEITGKTAYTKVVTVRKPAAAFNIAVSSNGSDRTINFLNATPDGIKLYDLNGRLLKKTDVAQSSYTIPGISAGVYILQFKVGTEQYTRKLFLQ